MSKFACPKCGSITKVLESRPSIPLDGRRRRRQCYQGNCRFRFTTVERIYVKEKKHERKIPRRYTKRAVELR